MKKTEEDKTVRNKKKNHQTSKPLFMSWKKTKTAPEKSKSWSQNASAGLVTQSSGNERRKTMKIKPVFDLENTEYDRIVITPTHFNKSFKAFNNDEKRRHHKKSN